MTAQRLLHDTDWSPLFEASYVAEDWAEHGSCPDERWYRLVATFRIRQGVGLWRTIEGRRVPGRDGHSVGDAHQRTAFCAAA